MGNELSSNSEREDAVGLREEAYQRRCRQRHKAELNTVNKAYRPTIKLSNGGCLKRSSRGCDCQKIGLRR